MFQRDQEYYVTPHSCFCICNLRGYLPRIEPSVLLLSKSLNRLSSVTPFYKWEAMSFHHKLSNLVSHFGKGPKRWFKKKNLFSELAKSLQPTLESSSIQTTESIVKCHTILEMGKPCSIWSSNFCKGSKRGFKIILLDLFSAKG